MTGLASMNSTTLGQTLGREIADAVVLVAKNMILGSDPDTIASVLGCPRSEVDSLMESQDYKDVHLILASHYNHNVIETDLTYDDIERKALAGLGKRIDSIKDPDQLVRIASMANRAVRRARPAADTPLDPQNHAPRVNLTLTRRMIERLTTDGMEREEIQQVSIRGGHVNPTFQQVDEFFGVTNRPRLPANYTHTKSGDEDVSMEALERLLDNQR